MKDALETIATSVVATIISTLAINMINDQSFTLIPSSKLIYVIAVLIWICIYFFLEHLKMMRMGIVKILATSDRGEGSTVSYMKSSSHTIAFAGIAASKWIKNEEILKETIRKICSQNTGYIKFLILDPDCDAAKKLTMANSQVDDSSSDSMKHSVSKKIRDSLRRIREMVEEISNNNPELISRFEIRLYDQMPIFRLAIIDEQRAYFCFYQKGVDGSKLKQMVIRPSHSYETSQENIFNSMIEYFDSLWNATSTKRYNLFGEPVE